MKRYQRLILFILLILFTVGIGILLRSSKYSAFKDPGSGVHSANVTTYYIKTDGNNTNSGLDWNNALKDPKAAVDKANGTDTARILIKSGTYLTDSYATRLDITKNNIQLLGSFTGNPANPEEKGTAPTILDSQNNYRVLKINGANNILVSDLTIQNGKIQTYSPLSGGCIYSIYSTVTISNSIIKNCVTTANDSESAYGGGIAQSSSDLTLNNTVIQDSTSQYSNGGCYYRTGYGALTITDVTMNNCNAPNGNGGGLYNDTDLIKATRLTISNSKAINGGGIYFYESAVNSYLTQSNLINNLATQNGGGVVLDHEQGAVISRTMIDGNQATNFGGAMYIDNNTNSVRGDNLIITNNKAQTAAIYITGNGNIYALKHVTISNNRSTVGTSVLYVVEGGMLNGGKAINISYNEGPLAPLDHSGNKLSYWFESTNFYENYKVDSKGNKTPAFSEKPTEPGAGMGTVTFFDPKYYNSKFVSDPMSYMISAASKLIDLANIISTEDFFGAKRPINGSNISYATNDIGAFEFPFNYVTNPFNQYLTFYNWLGPNSDKKFSDTESVHVTFSKSTGEKMLDRDIHLGTTDFSGQYPKSAYMLPSANIGDFNGVAIPKDTTGRLCFSYPSYLTKCQNVTLIGDGAPNIPLTFDGGDVNGDNHVGITDMGSVLQDFGVTNPPCTNTSCPDIDRNKEVGISDLGVVLSNFDSYGDNP